MFEDDVGTQVKSQDIISACAMLRSDRGSEATWCCDPVRVLCEVCSAVLA